VQYQLGKEIQSTDEIFVAIHPGKKWLRARAVFTTPQKEWDRWKMPQFNLKFYNEGNSNPVKVNFIRISRVLNDGETGMRYFDALIPSTCNKASVGIWNAGSDKRLIVKDLVVAEW
jgi:hypothetical protein